MTRTSKGPDEDCGQRGGGVFFIISQSGPRNTFTVQCDDEAALVPSQCKSAGAVGKRREPASRSMRHGRPIIEAYRRSNASPEYIVHAAICEFVAPPLVHADHQSSNRCGQHKIEFGGAQKWLLRLEAEEHERHEGSVGEWHGSPVHLKICRHADEHAQLM